MRESDKTNRPPEPKKALLQCTFRRYHGACVKLVYKWKTWPDDIRIVAFVQKTAPKEYLYGMNHIGHQSGRFAAGRKIISMQPNDKTQPVSTIAFAKQQNPEDRRGCPVRFPKSAGRNLNENIRSPKVRQFHQNSGPQIRQTDDQNQSITQDLN